ncbi:protein NRT1/ PTR FAMILY 5.5-like [Silene latifolia]|uniref:protein NRT1/ PTR FAMILY 5.5-like n=1 Tax=Silene latifolia TaxID=37657 RepID=UPI003D76B10B
MCHPRVERGQLYKGDNNDQIINASDSDSDSDNGNDDDRRWESTTGMKGLDKAAIMLPGVEPEKQKKNRWRLCTVGEVELTKMVLRMFPLWTTCILLGVISSIGDTYFLEQASHLESGLGKYKIPIIALLGVQKFVLLGGLNTMFEQGNTGLSNRFPKRVVRYMALSTTGINGLGRIGGVVSVYLAGRITRGENQESWFQSSLNKSRLDQYYWLLAAMSGVALGAYVIVACWHFYRESTRAVKENEEGHTALIEKCHWFCCG